MIGRDSGKAGQLADRVENDFVAVRQHFVNFVIGVGHAVGMGFTAEFLPAQFHFVQGRRGGAVHVLAHQVKYRPGGKAFKRQQSLGTRVCAHIRHFLHVLEQTGLVDQVIGSSKRVCHNASFRKVKSAQYISNMTPALQAGGIKNSKG